MDTQNFNKNGSVTEHNYEERDVELILQNVSKKKSIRDLFIDDKDDFEDAEIFYPSKMNEDKEPETKNLVQAFSLSNERIEKEINLQQNHMQPENKDYTNSPFILANTIEIPLHHLKNDCIIPVFSKDNEKTIAHQEFIDVVISAVKSAFPHQAVTAPEIRVSHQIKGRTPDAIHLNAKDLLEHQKTIYYERVHGCFFKTD